MNFWKDVCNPWIKTPPLRSHLNAIPAEFTLLAAVVSLQLQANHLNQFDQLTTDNAYESIYISKVLNKYELYAFSFYILKMNLSKVPVVFLFPVKVASPTPESWMEKWRKGTDFFSGLHWKSNWAHLSSSLSHILSLVFIFYCLRWPMLQSAYMCVPCPYQQTQLTSVFDHIFAIVITLNM